MSNHAHDYDKIVALLKSVAAACDTGDEHKWRQCRHCLAVELLEHRDVRKMLGAFLAAVKAVDARYGKP